MIKNFEGFLNESNYRDLHLGAPQELTPGITYELSPEIVSDIEDESGDGSSVRWVKDLCRSLKLKNAQIYFDTDEFLVSGVTLSGNVIYIEQRGEYNMYGGPYSPKMERPKIEINSTDYTDTILKAIADYHGDTLDSKMMTSEFGKPNYYDVGHVEPYGHLMDKSKTYFTSVKFGL